MRVAEGCALARERRPDLVLLDLRLPDVDGFEVCGELVDSPETCHIPIIIVSGAGPTGHCPLGTRGWL